MKPNRPACRAHVGRIAMSTVLSTTCLRFSATTLSGSLQLATRLGYGPRSHSIPTLARYP